MRQDPIEIGGIGSTARPRPIWRTRKAGGAVVKSEPCVVDEAFARFDGINGSTSRSETGHHGMMKQALVSDLITQLEAIDRQRERLARLLQSVEMNSIAE